MSCVSTQTNFWFCDGGNDAEANRMAFLRPPDRPIDSLVPAPILNLMLRMIMLTITIMLIIIIITTRRCLIRLVINSEWSFVVRRILEECLGYNDPGYIPFPTNACVDCGNDGEANRMVFLRPPELWYRPIDSSCQQTKICCQQSASKGWAKVVQQPNGLFEDDCTITNISLSFPIPPLQTVVIFCTTNACSPWRAVTDDFRPWILSL